MECRKPSKWRVTANPVGGKMWYAVYRIRDIDEVDHSGNRQYRGGYIDDKSKAEAYARQLNEEGTDGQQH